jgi:hypothetical protein
VGGKDLVGVQLTDKWELDDQKVHRYYVRIINRVLAKKNKSVVYTVGYWAPDEDEAEDFCLPAESLIAD